MSRSLVLMNVNTTTYKYLDIKGVPRHLLTNQEADYAEEEPIRNRFVSRGTSWP